MPAICCCGTFCNGGSPLVVRLPATRWSPTSRKSLSRPTAQESFQLISLRRPRQPPTGNQPIPLPDNPSSQKKVFEICNDDHELSSEDSSCSPSDVLMLMDALRLPVEEDLYLSLIKECAESKNASHGAALYSHVRRTCPGLLRRPAGLLLANRFLQLFAAYGCSSAVLHLFDQMPLRDATSFAVVISSLSADGSHRQALHVFVEMHMRTGDRCLPVLEPRVCWLAALGVILRSCVHAGELYFGLQLHGLVIKVLGSCEGAVFGDLEDSLLQFYSKFQHQENAMSVFKRAISVSRSAGSWTSMITGYYRQGQFKEAIYLFREMGRAGKKRNFYILSSTLPACAKMRDAGWSGKQVHAIAIKLGASSDKFVCSSLVDMYMKHELPIEGQRAFDSMDGLRDYVCWNALLIGYAQRGYVVDAAKLLNKMKANGIEPQESTVHHFLMAFNGAL
ncbi:pentatricopeptide repeat-containing protein At1g31790-like [Zingiber officinale]|uniref:Pentatricopeptide repeat-containing protein n=1 Tax=Zingiber officinale TaxID=94328 RepID=A0A8J5CE73_ZINOF|nr:pentatricopeptide repeat-containing protein At1g31790-like [Zingiber officinale]KAG6472374.1 hypothetical protein ZIOFF_069834 [Zingiber officinale]